jgi:ParB family chromosome partitioning protein
VSKRGLGRGLGALIAGMSEAAEPARELSVGHIVASPHQPRKRFDESALAELAASIREHGVLQPLVVRPVGDGRHELVAGERRWRAARSVGLDQVPVVVKHLDDRQAMEIALIENLQRADLTPLELAQGLKLLAEAFTLTHEDLANRVGMSRSAVTNALRLLGLPAGVAALLDDGTITAGHARALLGCADADRQMAIARRIAAEGLSVRAVETLVKTGKRQPEPKPAPVREPASMQTLRQVLGSPVTLRQKGDKGAIEIPFTSPEQRDTLLQLLAERLAR